MKLIKTCVVQLKYIRFKFTNKVHDQYKILSTMDVTQIKSHAKNLKAPYSSNETDGMEACAEEK